MRASELLVAAPAGVPLLAAAVYAVFGWTRRTAWLGAVAAALLLAAAVGLAVAVTGKPALTGCWGLLRVDALSAYMLIVIGAVALPAMLAGPGYLADRTGPRAAVLARRYGVFTQLFLAAMALAVLAASLGLVWVAVEATTIVTAFLVGHRHTRKATEAAWKYVVICSVGIGLALLGIVLLYFAALHAGLGEGEGLDLALLAERATALDPGVTRLAVLLLLLGFGTKAGLAPMHAWLPDAHSQAPAPVSALMSGVLLAVAFYAILRVKVVADQALGPQFTRVLLVAAALASLAVAAALLLAQRDFKRLLAYSSIEHMGLLALGAAVGGALALGAVLLHILGHGLAKSALFLGSGHIQRAAGNSRIESVRGLAARAPLLGGAFGVGLLALLGMPPFSLFASELGIARAGFGAGLGWVIVAAFALMLVIVAAVGRHALLMLLGRSSEPGDRTDRVDRGAIPLVAALGVCAVLGITLGPLGDLLGSAAAIATGVAP
ncbi:proton-conducting transporter transmembrane domain-containing protein [Acrocarpospora catenulata]|uniref:proton-conducting transporter transmembrane domain-containing protein n=1 Tax=Acrocarpospora catenulata TaxID=2836182 RepID=UPI001BDA9BA7|nr:proton-conducting transporter membrane subunit [Acrocarpospora catenulata]